MGAGMTQGEMKSQTIEEDITMAGISKNILNMSKQKNGEYFKFFSRFGIPENQDIEWLISLFENYFSIKSEFDSLHNELRKLFRKYLIKSIFNHKVQPKLMKSLLYLDKTYRDDMQEKLTGILTINYDSLIDDALEEIYGGVNLGIKYQSKDYTVKMDTVPLLKLHGSFNWKIEQGKIIVSKKFAEEEHEDDYSGWIPPSVYKKPQAEVYKKIWQRAQKLLVDCDVLRVFGASLRSEDWCLISLIFTSQALKDIPFKIELVVPSVSALGDDSNFGIMERLPFLAKLTPPTELTIIAKDADSDNIAQKWVLNTISQSGNSAIINDNTLLELTGGK